MYINKIVKKVLKEYIDEKIIKDWKAVKAYKGIITIKKVKA